MGASSQRQDALNDQMRDLIRIAEREGMYDAADWIKGRWTFRYALPCTCMVDPRGVCLQHPERAVKGRPNA